MIRFIRLSAMPLDWDAQILRYDTKTLFHESAWLRHVQGIHPTGRIEFYQIADEGEQIGLYCALRISKVLIPIQGSPLGGTGTNFMGPLVDRTVDQRSVIRALTALFGPRRFVHLEISNPWLDREIMVEAGFDVEEGVTHICQLPVDVDAAWGTLKSEARNRIRKAEKNGLIVERADDPAIVQHFFSQFTEVYAKQGMVTPFGIERPQSLFDCLNGVGRLLPIWVRRDEEILASGLFPFDDRCIYFWGAGSWLRHHALCPNEALQWGVMKFATQQHIPVYNMCGGGSQFKNKFGGEDVPYLKYNKSSVPLLRMARKFYKARHFRSLKRRELRAEGA